MGKELQILITVNILHYVAVQVLGHGRLMDPPARNVMWRFGFPTPVNYNDNELYCGGYSVQWEQNQGKCGVCGDSFSQKSPRAHEAGGRYAKGIVGRRYSVGQEIEVEIELTANHYGTFELLLCPSNNPLQDASQECFERYPLTVSGTNEARYRIPGNTRKKATLRYKARLPPYLTCSHCVLQWNYYTGNNWGTCANGTESVGCGRPETFRNCADISIQTSTAGLPPAFAGLSFPDINPFALYFRDLRTDRYSPLVIRKQLCVPTRSYRFLPGMRDWCQTSCLRYPPHCPPEICQCPDECEAIGELAGQPGADAYCQDKCIVYRDKPECPADKCRCY